MVTLFQLFWNRLKEFTPKKKKRKKRKKKRKENYKKNKNNGGISRVIIIELKELLALTTKLLRTLSL